MTKKYGQEIFDVAIKIGLCERSVWKHTPTEEITYTYACKLNSNVSLVIEKTSDDRGCYFYISLIYTEGEKSNCLRPHYLYIKDEVLHRLWKHVYGNAHKSEQDERQELANKIGHSLKMGL